MEKKDYKYNIDEILDIISAFHRETNHTDLLDVILTKMMEITASDAGTIYMLEDNKLHFYIVKNKSMNFSQSENIDFPPIPLDEDNIENISAYVALKQEIAMIDDVYECKTFNFSGPKQYDEMTGYRTQSMLVMPLHASLEEFNRVIGVIQLINATVEVDDGLRRVVPFEPVPILEPLANISANALANILHTHEVKRMFGSFVEVMTKAIDERSPYNKNHTYHVAELCKKFIGYLSGRFPSGHELYFNTRRSEQLVMAAYLHDIGKIITPLEIMNKPDRLDTDYEAVKLRLQVKFSQLELSRLKNEIGEEEYNREASELKRDSDLIMFANSAPYLSDEELERVKALETLTYTDIGGNTAPILTPDNMTSLLVQKGTLTAYERKIMQEHVSITGRLLEKMMFNQYYTDVAKWATGHHELLDGTGYPRGLSGDDVTTEICILTIMDIFDALTAADRPYKKAVSVPKAFDILRSMVDEGKLKGELVELFFDSGVYGD